MIEKIFLKFGSSPGAAPLEFDATPVTIFVGPNYSGKSKAIEELLSLCTVGRDPNSVIVKEVRFRPFSADRASVELERSKISPRSGEAILDGYTTVGTEQNRQQVPTYSFLEALQRPNEANHRNSYSSWFLSHRTMLLSGQTRITLTSDQSGGDLLQPAQNSLQHIFRNDSLREKLRQLVFSAFGLYLVVDPTSLGMLRYRLSPVPPPSNEIERGLSSESLAFHSAATHISDTSDGTKAFVGILAQLLAGDPQMLFIDEPEAFLHPSLALQLGREVSSSIASTEKRLFVSTHSPQFLMGCIQSGVPLNVIRLTYRSGVSTARLLPHEELVRLMRNPLLRSTGVLSALFYESVVVTEADPDRAFYQEINDRLLRSGEGRGIPNCIFLNAQNKQTIPTIIEPLRKLGIPAAAIYDVDMLKDKGQTAVRLLEAAGIPQTARNSLNMLRADVLKSLEESKVDFKRSGGITLLRPSDQAAASDYFDQLDAYGSFVVRHGELESWLRRFEIAGHGQGWLISMFEQLGEDYNSPTYIKPGEDDVWQFVEKIGKWLLNPMRKGIPI